MNTFKVVICLFALITSVHTAYGRLNETEAECINRYGAAQDDKAYKAYPLIDGVPHRVYHYQGWAIRVAFVDGVTMREEYHKLKAVDGSLQIKDFELEAILEGEKDNGSWKKFTRETSLNPITRLQQMVVDINRKVWVRTDNALAILRPGDMILRLEMPEAMQVDELIKKQKEEKQRAAVPKF